MTTQRLARDVDSGDAAREGLRDDVEPRRSWADDPHLLLASTLILSGDAEAGMAKADAVLNTPGRPSALYAAADSVRLLSLVATGDFERGRRSAEATLGRAGGPADDIALGSALAVLSMLTWNDGHLASALTLMRAAVKCADSQACDGPRQFARLALAHMRRATGDQADDLGIEMCGVDRACTDAPPWRIALALMHSRAHLLASEINKAIGEAERALVLAEDFGTEFLVPEVRATLAFTSLLRDRPQPARDHIERSFGDSDLVRSGSSASASRLAWLRALVLEATGDRRGALDILAPVYGDVASHLSILLDEPGAAAWLVRTALRDGDRRRASAVVSAAELLAAENRQFPCIQAIALHTRGLLESDAGALQRAATQHRQRWSRASAAEDAAIAVADLGGNDDARTQLTLALSEYVLAGSARDANRVRTRLASRKVRRTRAVRPVEGWDSLTGGERRIVALVAQGLTNRQAAEGAFLSRHTVDFHLRQVFRKLNISSRVELVRLALQHE